MPVQLIINADDFGASAAVNKAVVRARRFGLLTSASLMVGGRAVSEAVSIAKTDPGLAIGLHLTLTDGNAVLNREAVPGLVDADCRFAMDPVKSSLRYHFDRRIRRQLQSEIQAQFEAFAETGLPLSHVDGHQHLHAHPAILPMVIKLAVQYGAHGIRIPRDPFMLNMRVDLSHLPVKVVLGLGTRYLARNCVCLLKGTELSMCDISIGSLMSGRMNGDYVIRMLERVNCSSIEVYFHPADLPSEMSGDGPYGPNPGDLRALLSPRLKQFILNAGYQLTTYAGLSKNNGGSPDGRT